MAKGPGLYTDIGNKARDLLYKDYQTDQKFTFTTYSPTGVTITSTGLKKNDVLVADVNTQLNKNVTTDIKVDSSSNVLGQVSGLKDQPTPFTRLKSWFSNHPVDEIPARVVNYLDRHKGSSKFSDVVRQISSYERDYKSEV